MKQKILLLFLAIIASMGQLFAFSVEIDGLYYDGNVVYKTASVRFKSVSYPSGVPTYNEGWKITEANILSSITYEGVTYPVTSIGNNAFDGCTNLISVTIPNSITSIGSAAFNACQSLTSINIPNSVTSIGWDAFCGCTGLTYVIIPESVTSIGRRAFGGCTNADIVVPQSVTNIDEFAFYGTHYVVKPGVLEGCLILEGEDKEVLYKCISADVAEIIIPNSVTSIRDNAFSGCTGLTSVTIPNSVISIGTDVFSGCSGLTNINVDADNPNYCDLDGVLFNKDRTELILYPAGKSATSYTIPNSVTSIFNDAFNGCTNLTSVTIPNSVTAIGNSAFSGCSELTSVNIGNAVIGIGEGAFSGCNIANVYFSGTLAEWLSKAWSPLSISSSYNLYVNNELIKNAIIPNSVTAIGNSAFSGCSGLTSITIPNSVTAIGNLAFYGCSGLTSVNIGNSVASIGNYAFYGCTGLTSITIPNSVTAIGNSAFSGCSELTSITIPNSVISIDNAAFEGCGGLKSVVWNAKECSFPNLSKYNEAPFYNNANITSFSFGSEVESIPSYLCCGMTGLTSITISNSVASIGNYAFYGCSGLSSVTIGNSVSSIGNKAFEGCTGLTSVVWNAVNCPIYNSYPFLGLQITSFVFGDEVEAIPGSLCNGMTGLTSITIPNSVISIGDYAFYGCSGLKSISIGNSFASIGREAFKGCTGLNSVFWNAATFADFRDTTYPFPNQQITSFVFGDDVEYIPAYLCSGMTQLTSITIPESIQNISEKAFYGCTGITSIIWKARNGYASFETIAPQITSFNFGDNVNDIPRNLCQKMSKLTSITIPNSVIQISEGAFKECTGLEEINLGNSVRYIGKEAFYRCSGISTLTIPLSVNSIGESAFGECESLREIHISDLTAWLSIYFDGVSANPLSVAWGTELFLNGTALHDIVIPNEMSYINPYVFAGCSNIVSVTFPDNLTDIGDGAFYGCSLQTLSLPNTLRRIGANAFYASCSMLTSISFPNSIETIGAGAFSGAGFASINLPNSIKNIGHGAFYNNRWIEKITIPSSLIAIGAAAFAECPNLTSVQWNASDCQLEQIKDNDWYYNTSPFYNCPKLQSFSFGKNVKNIPEKLCSQIPITSIILPESITSISEEAFKGCDYLAELTIPNSVVTIKKNAFANCTDIEHIILGSGLRGIEDYAFDGCKRIEDITCYAERTPDITKYSFNNIGDKKSIPVYIIENRMNAYLKDALWAEFDLQVMGATTTTTDEVKITPTEIAAVVIWPAVVGAASYELVIKDKQGNVICTLIFDAYGLLTEIAFKAPGRDDAPQKTQAEGFSFTITGLDSGTEYDLTIVSKDENGDTLDEQTLSFTTEGEAPQSIDQITNDQLPITNKVLRNGQLLILHGDNTYTLTGQQVK